MATMLREGDRVKIAEREQNGEDAKSGLYYGFFRGLTGTVQKLYATSEVAVQVDIESLTEPIAKRHLEVQEQMKTKWLDGLSDEARGRLSDAEKDFRLHYSILVAPTDLAPAGPRALPEARDGATAPRKTQEDLDAAEAAELERRRGGA
jgi:hypothetical protein